MARDTILHKIRTALGRSPGQEPEPAPPIHLRIPEMTTEERISQLLAHVGNLAGKVCRCESSIEARDYVARTTAHRSRGPLRREKNGAPAIGAM
jgi:hypothetical protein